VNAAGYVRVDAAEHDRERCFRENAEGPATLARMCGERGIALLTFSSDQVFSGAQRRPYVESDPVAPVDAYGASKAMAEHRVLELLPSALVVRTSAFFGPWDRHNLLTQALEALHAGRDWVVPDAVLSPTYVPDLVNAALDLLIDAERGIWHLANVGEVSWLELVQRGAAMAGVSTRGLRVAAPGGAGGHGRRYTALGSERGLLLPPLEDALVRYVVQSDDQPARARLTEASLASPAMGA
jgi:dTDP-4-dehydrorhamnose reductase